jgi:hypothetical protein
MTPFRNRPLHARLLAGLLAASLALGGAGVQAAAPSGAAESGAQADQAAGEWHARQSVRVQRQWGIDVVGVRLVSSGWMLEFRYRVLDPVKAAPLRKKEARPYLVDRATGARLAVPAMENIGELRQTADIKSGRDYYIIFGNANKLVQRGGRVDVVSGAFSVEDLVVQ